METAVVEKLFDQAFKRKLSQLARTSDPNLWSQIASNKVDREYFSRWKWRPDMTFRAWDFSFRFCSSFVVILFPPVEFVFDQFEHFQNKPDHNYDQFDRLSGHAGLPSEWNVFFALAFFEPPAVRFDEFQGIGQQLEGASLDPFVRFPFVLVERSKYCDSRSFVEILLGDFRELLKTHDLDPSGFLLSRPEGDVEGRHWIALR